MRVIIIAFFAVILSLLTLGQQCNSQAQEQTGQFGSTINKRDVLELPRRDASPRIRLQRALKIAEGFIRQQKIDISSCYLFEARLISEERREESTWSFWWVSVRGNSTMTKDVRITVSMNGKPKRK
jgi:hypothetical protein